MPLVDNAHYVDSVGYTAVTAWAVATAKTVGNFVRATAPASGSERVFVCIVAGTTHATTQPTWVTTRGAKTTDNTVTWQECTGLSGVNGDLTNTPSWTITATPPGGVKNTAVVLGQIIKRDNGASYQICTTAGTAGNGAEPAFSDTAGVTTVDGGVTWTSLGVVGNFTGNQAPHAKLQNALTATWNAAGNTVYIKSSHSEALTSGPTLTGASTLASPQRWLCHNGGAYPPAAANLTTGALITTSGNLILNPLGAYIEGLAIDATGAAATYDIAANNGSIRFKNCTFIRSAGTSVGIRLNNNASTAYGNLEFDNCVCSFANVAMGISIMGGNITWKNSSIYAGAAVPNTLIFGSGILTHTATEFRGVDFSAAGSGKTIVGAVANMSGVVRLVNCKLNSLVVAALTPPAPFYRVEIINSDATTNYRNEIYNYAGTLTTETTIVRTGGASDGTTPISWKIITTANAKFEQPFECPPIAIWNDATGSSKTATIEGIWGGGAVPTDGDIWVEVEYLGTSGNPGASFVSDAKATVLTTAAAQTASSETWGGSTTDFKLSVSFTPQMKGFVYARVKVGAASQTLYVDPKITLS